jgi:hypothetical protein
MLRRLRYGDRAASRGGGAHGKWGSRSKAGGIVLVAALATFAFAVGIGSAAALKKTFTASFAPGSVAAGATGVHLTLTIANTGSQSIVLGSANVTAATNGGSSFTITDATASQGNVEPPAGPTLLKLRNLNLQPGTSMTVDVVVNTPSSCSTASYSWGIAAKQSNDFNGTGNDFTLQAAGSNLTTSITGNCHLAVVKQPTDAQKNQTITASDGGPVQVGVFDGNGNPAVATGNVSVAITPGTGAFADGKTPLLAGTKTQALNSSGVASFGDLSIDTESNTQYTLSFSSSFGGVTSTGFTIFLSRTTCAPGDQCGDLNTPTPIGNGNSTIAYSFNGSSFTFLAVNPDTIPASVTAPGGGCQYLLVPGPRSWTGFVEVDGPTSTSGEKTFRFGVKKSLITKLYGTNQGQQFIPLCAGAKRIVDGVPEDCSAEPADSGWMGKALGPDGKFNGQLRRAVCGPDGLWWGVLGSFQDYTNANPALVIDPSWSPTVYAWDSDTTYRYFYIRVPAGSGPIGSGYEDDPWDYKCG